jgi:hypothetical protein
MLTISTQRRGKHSSTTIESLMETEFSTRSVQGVIGKTKLGRPRMENPVPGAITGPHSSWGIQKGGPTLQVGGFSNPRQ